MEINRMSRPYHFKNYQGNYLTPFLETKEVMIVYVHGFLGSKNTFHDFPDLLKESLKLYNVNVTNKIFPAFDTNGEFNDFVNMVIDWLYQNAGYYPVILMGHSMGGILVADVYRKISKNDVDFKHANEIPPKIVGVFGFDSPFFGLSSAIANAGVRKLKESISSATKSVASFLAPVNKEALEENYIDLPPTYEESQKMAEKEKEKEKEKYENEKETALIQRSQYNDIASTSTQHQNDAKKHWKLLNNVVLGGATVAALGTSLFDQTARNYLIYSGQKMICDTAQSITNYIKFLEPLIEISKQRQRVDDLINSARRSIIVGNERFKFKNYYPITKIEKNDGTVNKSTFVCLPQDMRYLKFFDPVPGAKNAPDAAFSHTKMFNSLVNGENVHILADKCLIDLYKIIRSI